MRILKIFTWLVFVLSLAAFLWYNQRYYLTRDTMGPAITVDGDEIRISVNDGELKMLEGVTAWDAKDGDVTDSLGIENMSEFIEGTTREISIVAFDQDDHVERATRRITYTDYTPVRYSLDAPLRFSTSQYVIDILSQVHAVDCLDGDISSLINFSQNSTINVDIPGEYRTVLEVKNSAGDIGSLPVTITIYDYSVESLAPAITLSEYLVYTRVGQEIDPMQYIVSMFWRGTEYAATEERGTFRVSTEKMSGSELKEFRKQDPAVNLELFTVTDYVNYQLPGVYEIRYNLEDDDGNRGEVALIVVVEE